MTDFLSNRWVKRAVSVFNIAYFAVICLLTFATFVYKLEFTAGKEVSFFVVYFILSAVFLALMIFSRKEIMTCVISVMLLPVCFLLILFNMGMWVLIVPPFVVALVMFFVSGTNETVKVVMGTIYLLMYVLGLVAYFVLNLLFGGSSVITPLDNNLQSSSASVYKLYKESADKINDVTQDTNTISPDGKYRIVLYDIQDSDKGAVRICVVPYGEDIELNFFTLKQKGIEKTISTKGTRGIVPDVGWIEEDGVLKVQYRLSPESEPEKTSVTEANMPTKQYLEFLGIK